MKTIRAKKDFTLKGKFYSEGQEVNDIKDIEIISRLNEKGFIFPLTRKDIEEIRNGNNKSFKKEEEINE